MGHLSVRTAVIADQYPLWLDALRNLLERIGFDVVGAATSPADLAALIDQHKPTLLVASVSGLSDDSNDAEEIYRLVARARRVNTDVRCIVLGEAVDPATLERAFDSGATAFCVKRAEPEDIAAAIRQSFSDSVYFSSRPRGDGLKNQTTPAVADEDNASLTKREREVLSLTAEGHSNAQLAKMLWVTEKTVKFHLSNIYRKLHVKNRTEASRWAERHELHRDKNAA
jgi:DNA-binding NarL/FixJ family response regulator